MHESKKILQKGKADVTGTSSRALVRKGHIVERQVTKGKCRNNSPEFEGDARKAKVKLELKLK